MAISNFSKECYIPHSDRDANGSLKLASFLSSGLRCSALGRLEFVHLHLLNGVHYIVPPPVNYQSNNLYKEQFYFVFFNNIFIFSWVIAVSLKIQTAIYIIVAKGKEEKTYGKQKILAENTGSGASIMCGFGRMYYICGIRIANGVSYQRSKV